MTDITKRLPLEEKPTRSDRRERTSAAILDAARELFCERGYERTTIRAIAAHCGVDPALVLHYFGSKDLLFGRIAAAALDDLGEGPPERLAERVVAHFVECGGYEDESTLALIRSSLTHEPAAELVRATLTSALCGKFGRAVDEPDARLRAALVAAVQIGVVISRSLLRIEVLRDASTTAIGDLLRPCIEALLSPGVPSDAARAGEATPRT